MQVNQSHLTKNTENLQLGGGVESPFADKEYCFSEMQEARKIFGDRNQLTLEKADNILKMMAMMYLYCPDEIRDLVEGCLYELELRRYYFVFGVGNYNRYKEH